nr:hypothetical protein [Tanacetum cinerariifolium]
MKKKMRRVLVVAVRFMMSGFVDELTLPIILVSTAIDLFVLPAMELSTVWVYILYTTRFVFIIVRNGGKFEYWKDGLAVFMMSGFVDELILPIILVSTAIDLFVLPAMELSTVWVYILYTASKGILLLFGINKGSVNAACYLRGRFDTLGFKCLGVNVYTASYHEFVLLRMMLSTAYWNFSTATSLFIQLVSTTSVSRYRTTKIDGMSDIEWNTCLDLGHN